MHQRMFPSLHVNINEELEKYKEFAQKLKPLVIETVYFINDELKKGKRILVEGANAAMLDIDFGGYSFIGWRSKFWRGPTSRSFSILWELPTAVHFGVFSDLVISYLQLSSYISIYSTSSILCTFEISSLSLSLLYGVEFVSNCTSTPESVQCVVIRITDAVPYNFQALIPTWRRRTAA